MVKYYSRACIFLQDEISMHWNACEGFYPSPPMKPQQTTYFLFFFQVWIPHSVGLGQHLRTFRILAPNSPFSKLHIRAYFKYCRILRRIFGVSLAKHLPHGRARGRVHGASTPVGYSGEDLQVRRTDRSARYSRPAPWAACWGGGLGGGAWWNGGGKYGGWKSGCGNWCCMEPCRPDPDWAARPPGPWPEWPPYAGEPELRVMEPWPAVSRSYNTKRIKWF